MNRSCRDAIPPHPKAETVLARRLGYVSLGLVPCVVLNDGGGVYVLKGDLALGGSR